MLMLGQTLILLIAILGVIWCWKNPRYFLPFVIISLPLDISRTWFPDVALLNQLASFVGVITFARVFSLAFIAYYLWGLIRRLFNKRSWANLDTRSLNIWEQSLILVLILYILFGLVSTIWSVNPMKSIAESIRLIILLLLGFATLSELIKQKDAWIIPKTFSVVSTVLGLLGIYQMIFKNFLWMGERYLAAGRINATFVDANIYARFLIIGVLATLIWMIERRDLRSALLGVGALMIQFIALIGTGSRTGWLIIAIVLLLFVILVPRRQVLFVFVGVFVAALLGIAWHPEVLSRITDLQKGLAIAATERQYLMKAGLDMFKNHPVLGVGLGGFQTMMFSTYPDLIHNEISLSHTSLITTGAELGIIGLFILSVFLLFVYRELFWSWGKKKVSLGISGFTNIWLVSVFAVLAITAIFLSAQGEGRFFEDPALWILVGYLVSIRNVEEV